MPQPIPATNYIETLLRPAAEALGYNIVLARRTRGYGGAAVLQILAERLDHQPMRIDDCADLSRELSTILDVEDPIQGTYTLEVSSPGIDRPLVQLADYDRFAGFEIKVETGTLHDGRRRFRGRLIGCDDQGMITLDAVSKTRTDGKSKAGAKKAENNTAVSRVSLPFDDIVRAKLVLSDELIAATRKPH